MQTSDFWDWFPIVFFPLKLLVLGIGMFYAIKWHRDQEKKDQETRARRPAPVRDAPPKA
jgi:hypothetical protein